MNCLLDTHAFLWAAFEPGRLSASARRVLLDPASTAHVSAVSFWELSHKFKLGKLELHGVTPEDLPAAAEQMGFARIPLDPAEAASHARLDRTAHKDPFDRMLIWQALQRQMVLISADAHLEAYRKLGLQVLW